MNFFLNFRMRRFAKRDSEVCLQLGDAHAIALIGPRPESDSEKYADQGQVADDLQKEQVVEEYEHSLIGQATSPTIQPPASPPPGILILGITLFLAVGTVANIQLMALLGWEPSNRILLGIALECLLVALTTGVREAFEKQTLSLVAVISVSLYVLFLLSTAALRLYGIEASEGGPTFMDWAAASLLVFATAGPAWLLESSIRLLLESTPHRNQKKRAARQFRTTQHRVEMARQHYGRLGKEQREWDRKYQVLMAIYQTTNPGALVKQAHENEVTPRDFSGNGTSHEAWQGGITQ